MKRKIKTVAVILACVMSVTLFAGCGSKSNGAKDDQRISELDAEGIVRHAKEIKSYDVESHTEPYEGPCLFLMYDQRKDGAEYHVKSGDEGCLACSGICKSELLKRCRYEKKESADQTAYEFALIHQGLSLVLMPGEHEWYEHQTAYKGPDAVKGKGSDLSSAFLGNECGTPDERGEEQQKICFHFIRHSYFS